MKNLILFILMLTISVSAYAGSLNSNGTYKGKVKGVAIGFWGHVGIGLDGATCNGKNEVLLLSTNPKYKDILSVLLAAEASGKEIVLYRVSSVIEKVHPSYSYCVVRTVSFGHFRTWL